MFNRLGVMLAALAALVMVAVAGPAGADEIELDATHGAPVVDVQINGQPVRLIVDTRMPAIATINSETAGRLRLRPLPGFLRAAMELDGDRILNGRIARPTMRFDEGHEARIVTALFPSAVIEGADGMIGPGALPYDIVRIRLSGASRGDNARRITLENAGDWSWTDAIDGARARVSFDLARRETLLARRITSGIVERSTLAPTGGINRTAFRFGITMNTQAMISRSPLFVGGFALVEIRGHTDDVLILPNGWRMKLL